MAKTKLPPELEQNQMFAPGSSFGIMSGEKPRYRGEMHDLGHEGLRNTLQSMGLAHDETAGHYDGPERAVVVYNPSREQMFELGRKFGQESVIWGHNHRGHPGPHSELLYTNGPHSGKAHLPAESVPHVEHFREPPENYYTQVPGGKSGYFRLNYDMDKLHPVPLNVGTRHPQSLAAPHTPRPDLNKNLKDAQARRPPRPHPHAYPWHDGHTRHNSLHAVPGAVLVRKNDGGRTDQGLMWDPATSQKGSFAKGAITDPQLGLQPYKGSIAAGMVAKGDNIGGPNAAGDMSVPPPRGSFGHMADVHGHHEDGQVGKAEDNPGGNPESAAAGKAPEYHHFAAPFGTVNPKEPTELRHYRYEGRLGDVQRQVKDHGFQTYKAGGRHGKPDLANKNYNTGHLMIYDPDPGSGSDFGDSGYTEAWRSQHELAHALTYPEINKLYGEGRRIGKLGTHRSLNEAKRAVHWEWLAAHRQRELAKQLGIHISDADFARETNTVMHDAAHRAVTGKFTEPGGEGFTPHQHLVPLETALGLVNEHARRLGLQDPHATLQKSILPEDTTIQTHAGETNRIKRIMVQHDIGKGYTHSGTPQQCYDLIGQKFQSKRRLIQQLTDAGHTPETHPQLRHHVALMHWMGEFLASRKTPLKDPEPPGQAADAPQSRYGGGYAPWGRAITGRANQKSESDTIKGEVVPLRGTPMQDPKVPVRQLQGQVASVFRLPTGNTIGSCDVCGQLGHLTHRLAEGNHVVEAGAGVCTTCANHPKTTGPTVPNTGRPLTRSEPQSTATVAPTELRSMADGKNDPKYFTPEQGAFLLAKALHARIDAFAQTLETLQKREKGMKTCPDCGFTHRADGTVISTGGPGKVACSSHLQDHPVSSKKTKKPELSKALAGGMGNAAPGGASGPQALGRAEPLSKPSTSQAQNRAMHAAASGNSTLGIPKSVGQDFVHADEGKKVSHLPEHKKGELEKVAPPGREEQVRALKPKVGAQSAFKIAWASYNHGKETRKSSAVSGQSENVSNSGPGQALMMGELEKQMPAAGMGAGAGRGAPVGAGVASPSSPVQGPMSMGEPQPNNLREKQAVPVKTDDPRSNNFVTAGNNHKSEKDAGGKTDGRTNTLRPEGAGKQGTLSGDKTPPEISHGDASGNIHPAHLEPGGMAPSNKVKEAPIRKDDVPMAKPPSGNPTAGGAKPSQSKPSGGGMKTPSALGGFKTAMSKAFDIGTKQGGAAQASFHAAKAPTAAPAVKMPTMAEHGGRADTFQQHMPPGKFSAPAAAAPGPAAKPAAPAGTVAPASVAKPAAPVGGIQSASSGSLPVSSQSAFGGKLKPVSAVGQPMGVLGHLPRLKAALSPKDQAMLQRSEKAKK